MLLPGRPVRSGSHPTGGSGCSGQKRYGRRKRQRLLPAVPQSRSQVPPLRAVVVERRQGERRRAAPRAVPAQGCRYRRRGDQPRRVPARSRRPRGEAAVVAEQGVDRHARRGFRPGRETRHDLRPDRRLGLAFRRRVPQRRRTRPGDGRRRRKARRTARVHHIGLLAAQGGRPGHQQGL